MTTIYLTGKEPLVREIIAAAYPSWRGNKFRLETATSIDVRSFWDGGSRDYFVFVKLAGTRCLGQVPDQSAFDRPICGAGNVELPVDLACVRHSFYRGKDAGMTITVNPAALNPSLLPAAPVEMTDDEMKVLYCTRCYISSARREASMLSAERWDAGKLSLIARGYLAKNGGITPAGRNAAATLREKRTMSDLQVVTTVVKGDAS